MAYPFAQHIEAFIVGAAMLAARQGMGPAVDWSRPLPPPHPGFVGADQGSPVARQLTAQGYGLGVAGGRSVNKLPGGIPPA